MIDNKQYPIPETEGIKQVLFFGNPLLFGRPFAAVLANPIALGYVLFKNGRFPELIMDGMKIHAFGWFEVGEISWIYVWDSLPLNFN
jgi:hypothetical protein